MRRMRCVFGRGKGNMQMSHFFGWSAPVDAALLSHPPFPHLSSLPCLCTCLLVQFWSIWRCSPPRYSATWCCCCPGIRCGQCEGQASAGIAKPFFLSSSSASPNHPIPNPVLFLLSLLPSVPLIPPCPNPPPTHTGGAGCRGCSSAAGRDAGQSSWGGAVTPISEGRMHTIDPG